MQKARGGLWKPVNARRHTYNIPTKIAVYVTRNIEKVIEHCHKLLEKSGMDEEGQVAMGAAFREGVVNAAQHGNKYKRDKKIRVQYLLDRENITEKCLY